MIEDDTFAALGTHEAACDTRVLKAGPVSVTLEDGQLRAIRHSGREILRGIAFLVRDRDWGTCPAELSPIAIETQAAGFRVTYRATYAAPSGAELAADIRIAGDVTGTVTFAAEFVTNADFETARAGFVVLHPVKGVAGSPVRIEHGDGSVEDAVWPDLIEPWQPFQDIVAITHRTGEGIEATTRFSGDMFEMEDQRNWTDASYKTYVRPLALPWPYLVAAGIVHRQSVTVTMTAPALPAPSIQSAQPVTLAWRQTKTTLPRIGLGLRPDCRQDEADRAGDAARMGFGDIVAHFDPLAGHGPDDLDHYAQIQARTGLPVTLELALPCLRPVDEELATIAADVRRAGLTLSALMVSPSVDRQSTPPGSAWPACPPLADIHAAARAAFPGLTLFGGMLSYFTELNRKRVPAALVDGISHCTNPIVHAADDVSVMQSFEALADVVRSVRHLYPDQPYRIGPSTIAMRQNPYGSATKDNPALRRIPMAHADPRHNARFGAAWTLAYAATVAPAGLDLLTLSTLAGPFGLFAGSDEPAPAGTRRPLAFVLEALAGLAGRPLLDLAFDPASPFTGLGARREDGSDVLLMANLTPESQQFALPPAIRRVEILAAPSASGDGFVSLPLEHDVTVNAYGCVRLWT